MHLEVLPLRPIPERVVHPDSLVVKTLARDALPGNG
jgi:hypothetical protein